VRLVTIGHRMTTTTDCPHASRLSWPARLLCGGGGGVVAFYERAAGDDGRPPVHRTCAAVDALSSNDNNRKTASAAAVATLAVALVATAAATVAVACGRTPHPLRRYTRDCVGRAGCGRRTFRRAWPRGPTTTTPPPLPK